jgi:PST family polysaccharide transporter
LAATHGWGAWSLVAQQIVLWVCKLTWVTLRAGARVKLMFRFSEVRDILIFGANNIGATLADYISRNIDNMIVGGVLGATMLGYYAMAYQMIRIPDMLISGPFYYYIFTALSRAAHAGDRAEIQNLAKAGLRLGSAALAPLFCGLALTSDLAVGVVLGPKWVGAIGVLRWLSAAGFGFCLCSIMAAMLTGLGRAGLQLRLALMLSLATIVTVGGAVRFGLVPVAAALACGVACVCVYYLDQLARDLKASRSGLALALAPAAIGCAVLCGVVFAVRQVLAGQPRALILFAALTAGALAYLAVMLVIARKRLIADARAFSRIQNDSHAATAAQGDEAEVVTPAQAEAALSAAG